MRACDPPYKALIVFLVLVVVIIIGQNFASLGLANVLGLDSLTGMTTGSIPMIGDGAVVVEVNGVEYYYFNVENCGLKNGTQKATIFEVLAYDSNGTLISSYKASF